jgi:HD-GYP domain-containing protein (c-di-GMP phosphodiesterase class II)
VCTSTSATMHSDTPLTIASPSHALRRRLIQSALRGVDDHWSAAPDDLLPGHTRDRVVQPLIIQTAAAVGEDAGGHMMRVGRMARAIAKRIGWTDADAADIALYGILHDVGKADVRAAVLSKPGPLTPSEESEVRLHTVYGHDLLARSRTPLLRAAAVVALQHHERWDGRGYPGGLRGEEIDLRARVVTLADVYDALTSDRPYRPALSASTARDLMRGMRGTHFDPTLFELFESAWDELDSLCS